MRFIFLDIDGCLNDRTMMSNGFCGIDDDKVALLNQILSNHEDVFLVISSAWRYMCIAKDMTLRGFEEMLLTHGVDCYGRVHGITSPDEKYWPDIPTSDDYADLTVRARQIEEYVQQHNPQSFVVFDDLDLPVDNIVKTDGQIGLEQHHIYSALNILFQ
jgi:hypothetical protein